MTEHNECPTCNGRGGELEHDSDGDGVWAMQVTYLNECPACLGDDKCPGCMQPIEATAIARSDIEEWTCPTCGWHIDWDRLGPTEVDWGY
jgi:hypothetical protein